ncbi:hypothetical protein VTL71DRAFT_6704 [Oculimacula yallundae]|uniref:Enoyl reductase (ER) domain-containing protein n=1 Tax=Oculimacula yallundae TaxID=86028 RepID=A0ABR4C0C0_9HELO
MATNKAAFLTSPKSHPFTILPTPLTTPGPSQILIQNHAIAINPIDFKLQSRAIYPLTYPAILGSDVAGIVHSIGSSVTRFAPGDRVLGLTNGFASGKDAEKAFQEYTVLEADFTCGIPDRVGFEEAVVLPLGVATAAAGLFDPEFLGLQLPTQPAQVPNGKTILVWGGAGCVGGNAVQLCAAAGYEVIATCSAKNFTYVKNLGASQVFDYNNASVVADLVSAFKGKASAGVYDAIGGAAWAPAIEFAQKTGTKIMATITPGFPDEHEGLEMKRVFAPAILGNGVGKAIFEDFLPKALGEGSYIVAPETIVAGRGLEILQVAVDLLGKGVSAKKVVVLL